MGKHPSPPTKTELLGAALDYARAGYSVIPVRPKQKQPLVKWQEWEAKKAGPNQIRSWWMRWPDANIAVVTGAISGVVVVDVDEGARPEVIQQDSPTGLISITPNNGFHLWYHHPGFPVKTQAAILPNIDIRGDGGYVLVPPSILGDGPPGDGPGPARPYSWRSTGEPGVYRPGQGPALAAPHSPAPGVQQEDRPRTPWVTNILKGVGEGERNDSATRLTGYLVSKDIPRDIAFQLMSNWNRSLADPIPGEELARTVHSVYTKHKPNGKAKSNAPWTLDLRTYASKYSWQTSEWMVEDWMPSNTCALIVSPPGSFKTWLLTELSVAVATGTPFLGSFRTRQGPVLVIQQEDPHTEIISRFATCYASRLPSPTEMYVNDQEFEAMAIPDMPIHVHPHRELLLNDKESMNALADAVRRIRPALVTVDPLYSTAGTEDFMASAARHMMLYKDLRDEVGCSFAIAHHTKKTTEGRRDRTDAWGSQFLNAWLETGWQIRPGEQDSVIVNRHFKVSGTVSEIGLQIEIDEAFRASVVTVEEAQRKKTSQADDIMFQIVTNGPASVSGLAKAMGKSPHSIRRTIKQMEKDGMLQQDEATKRWSQTL